MINRRETIAPLPEREVSYTRPFNDDHGQDYVHILTLPPQPSPPSRSTSPPNPQRIKDIFHKLLQDRTESPRLAQIPRPSSGPAKNHFVCVVPASHVNHGDTYYFVVDNSCGNSETSASDCLTTTGCSSAAGSLCANTSSSKQLPTTASPPTRPSASGHVRMASFSMITPACDERPHPSNRNAFMLPESCTQNIDRDESQLSDPAMALPQTSYNRSFNRSLNSATMSRSSRSIDPETRKSIVSLVMSFSSIGTSSSSNTSHSPPSFRTSQHNMENSQDDLPCQANNRFAGTGSIDRDFSEGHTYTIDNEMSVAHAQKIIESAGGKAKFIEEMRSLYSDSL